MKIDQIIDAIIGAAKEVHRTTGPGLLESNWLRPRHAAFIRVHSRQLFFS